jgi:HTH-type transcriptional regulator/antitoxin HipB
MQDHLLLTTAQLGHLLRSGRIQAKLSQAEVGARLQLSQSRVSKLESDPASLTVAQLLELCTLYGLDLVAREKSAGAADRGAGTPEW